MYHSLMTNVSLVEPDTLDEGGRKFWDSTMQKHAELSDTQVRNLFEACRMMDLLDALSRDSKHSALLDAVELGDSGIVEIRVDRAVAARKSIADMQAKLLATCRLDTDGQRKAGNPGAIRGSYRTKDTGKVSSLERRRNRVG